MIDDLLRLIQSLERRVMRLETHDVSQPVTLAIPLMTLLSWTESGNYEMTATTVDNDGVITTATVKWPDGSSGTFTTTIKNTTWLSVDAYTITHTTGGETVTQAAVTRDSDGNVTVKPALTVVGATTAILDTLKSWTEGESYEVISASYDVDGVVTTATVKWPDGSSGTFTTTIKNTTWLSVDAYTITHTTGGETVTQAAVTRDSDGNVTVKPALTVA
jgi:hypothetical protein